MHKLTFTAGVALALLGSSAWAGNAHRSQNSAVTGKEAPAPRGLENDHEPEAPANALGYIEVPQAYRALNTKTHILCIGHNPAQRLLRLMLVDRTVLCPKTREEFDRLPAAAVASTLDLQTDRRNYLYKNGVAVGRLWNRAAGLYTLESLCSNELDDRESHDYGKLVACELTVSKNNKLSLTFK